MARINIDDDVESRPEYRKLLKSVNYDDDKALGMLVRFWRLAQKYWGEHKLVPMQEMEDWEFLPLIESKWAIVKEDGGIYAKGAEERFAWYRQKCDAGKKGGRPRIDPPAEKEPEETENNRSEPDMHSDLLRIDSVNPLAPVPVPAPAPAPAQKQESIGETALAVCLEQGLSKIPKKKEPDPKIGKFIGVYVKSFQDKYPPKEGGTPPRPDLRGKILGQIKRYLDEIPIDRACDLIQAYYQMDDPWFKTKCHDFGTFIENQNKISLALDRGEDGSQPGSHIDWSKFT